MASCLTSWQDGSPWAPGPARSSLSGPSTGREASSEIRHADREREAARPGSDSWCSSCNGFLNSPLCNLSGPEQVGQCPRSPPRTWAASKGKLSWINSTCLSPAIYLARTGARPRPRGLGTPALEDAWKYWGCAKSHLLPQSRKGRSVLILS